jgi:tetratricopeptide (TPR) repeat protein
MGPMETLQIVEGLLSRQLRVVNRVSRDGSNFRAICNEEYFEEFIIKLIEKLTPLADKENALNHLEAKNKDFSELSGVHSIDVNSLGITEQLEHAKQLQRASADLSGLRKILIEIRTNRKVVIQAQANEEPEDFVHPDDKDVYIEAGPSLNPFQGGNKYVVGVFVFVAAVFFGLDYQKKQAMLEEQAKLEAEQEAKISSKYLGTGGASSSEKVDDSALIKAVTDLLELPPNKEGVQSYLDMQSYIASANSAVVNGVTVSRVDAKRTFNTLMDRASVRILKDENDKAEELLLHAIKIPFQSKVDALTMLMNVAYKIDSRSSSNRFVRVQSVLKMIDKYEKVDSKVGQRDKLAFVKFLGYHYSNNTLGVNTSFRAFLKFPPEPDFGAALGYKALTSWESLLADCVNVYNSRRSDGWANAMLTGCLLRTSKADKASAYAGYALSMLPNEEDVIAVAGLAYLKSGDKKQAKSALWQPIKGTQASATVRLAGRKKFCEAYPGETVCMARDSASLFPPKVRKKIRKTGEK